VRIAEHHLEPGASRIPNLAVRELKRRLFKVANSRRDHRIEVSERVLAATSRRVRELVDRIEAANEELAGIGERMRAGLRQVDIGGLVTAIDLGPKPTRGLRRTRVDQQRLARVQDRLVAELESRLRRDVVEHAAPLLAAGYRLADLTKGAVQMLHEAVAAWLGVFSERSDGSVESLIGEVASSLKAGPDDDPRAAALRSSLEPTWWRFGDRMASVWSAARAAVDPSNCARPARRGGRSPRSRCMRP
jgi:hypothetical protein